jgi:hypothetical protein
MEEHQNALVVEFAVLIHLDGRALPGTEEVAHSACQLGQPLCSCRPGTSGTTNPSSGFAHAVELKKSPHSEAAKSERTTSSFGGDI